MNELVIRDLVSRLSWVCPKEEQYFDLLFNKNLKETWENIVLVIEKIGCPKNEFFKIAEISENEDPTYYNTISEFKFKRNWHSEHGCEDVIDFSRKMVEKYKIRGSAI